jgi:hypothetical protein
MAKKRIDIYSNLPKQRKPKKVIKRKRGRPKKVTKSDTKYLEKYCGFVETPYGIVNIENEKGTITYRNKIPNQLWEMYKSGLVDASNVLNLVYSNQKVEMILSIDNKVIFL